jgi:MoaD family protein
MSKYSCIYDGGVSMKIQVKFLAAVADYAGVYKTELELDDDITFKDAVEIIRKKYPGVREIEKKIPILILLNGRKADPDTQVKDGDRIAFLPPISGG